MQEVQSILFSLRRMQLPSNPSPIRPSSGSSPGQCLQWCASNTDPKKCTKFIQFCSGCDECNSGPNPPAPPPPGQCKPWCARNTDPEKCRKYNQFCSACDECNSGPSPPA